MSFKKVIAALGLMPFMLAFAPSAFALALLGDEPGAVKIYDAGNGLEWVWAAPCAGESPSCGVVQLHHNFRFATDLEWLDSFTDLAGLITAFDATNYDSAICAAPEFSTVHNHCDAGDVIGGWIWHAPVGIAFDTSRANSDSAETFLVRGRHDVSEPAGLALLGLGLLGLGMARKRRQS